MSSAPDEPPENIRLQRAFPFYRFLNRPVGRLYHQYQYSQNQMNDCLNWCISAFMLRKFAVAPSVPEAILASLFARAQVTTKLLFRHNNSPDPVGQLARLVFQFLYEYPGTLNQQSSDLFVAPLANP